MKSKIYWGQVMHRRLAPVDHAFDFPLYFYGFDLSETAGLDEQLPLFGYNRRRVVALHDRDYLDGSPRTLDLKIRDWLRSAGVARNIARIELVTSARYFNYVFNPVSFYLCHDNEDRLCCVVAEVNNTFGDRHLYLVPELAGEDGSYRATKLQRKDFHVSPFHDMEGEYEFHFSMRDDAIDIRVNLLRDGKPAFLSTLSGRSMPLTHRNLLRTLLRFPLSALKTMPRIIGQAFVLKFRKKLPVYGRPEPVSPRTIVRRPPGRMQRLAMHLVLRLLRRLRHGSVRLVLPDGKSETLGEQEHTPELQLRVRSYSFFTRLVRAGDIGFGEAYVEGEIECDDLAGLLGLLARNRDLFPSSNLLAARLALMRDALSHAFRRNTKHMSRRNIHEHYDLSNAFFKTFLDPTMTYSCGRYRHAGESLEQAQKNKLQSLIEKARINASCHVLEIGSGWGSLAIEAARSTGCRVTSITISEEQHRLATERVREAGLEDRVEIRLCDYRDVEGSFDRIVSVEMLEAVGHAYLGQFFATCEKLLEPNGIVVLQVITYPDQGYDTYRRSSDWIRKHIFPGGHLPSLNALCRAMTENGQLVVQDLENIGPDYATTLRAWREKFDENVDQVTALGMDERFRRKWVYYLSYCEAGFAIRFLADLQLVLARPGTELPTTAGTWTEGRPRVAGQAQPYRELLEAARSCD